MKKLVLFVVSSLTVFAAHAEISYSMPAVEAGFKYSSMDAEGPGSDKQTVAWNFGGSVVLNFAAQLGLKTGIFYSERPFEQSNAGVTVDGKITYADIPLQLMYKLEDYAGIYFGPSISMKIGDEVSVGNLNDVKGMVLPISFGGQFKFTPNLGVNVYVEMVSGKLAQGLKDSRGIGANLLFTFD